MSSKSSPAHNSNPAVRPRTRREPLGSTTLPIEGQDLLIAEGAYSRCYQHPEDPGICIKLRTSDPKARKRLRDDLAYFRQLHAKGHDLTYIADYLGPCTTDLGPGHLFERVTDSDGSTSKTLAHYLAHEVFSHEEIAEALEKLISQFLEHRIMISDLHSLNILLKVEPGQKPVPMVVDGIGDRVFFKVLNRFDSRLIAKVTRRWNRFIDKLLRDHPSLAAQRDRLRLPEKS